MRLAYSRSLHAMAITSLTDSVAFLSNVLSLIPVCRVFGVFMGILILVDFFLCLSYFPAVVVLHHRWTQARAAHKATSSSAMCGWLWKTRDQPLLRPSISCSSTSSSEAQTELQATEAAAVGATATEEGSGGGEKVRDQVVEQPSVSSVWPEGKASGTHVQSVSAPGSAVPWTSRLEDVLSSGLLPRLQLHRRAVVGGTVLIVLFSAGSLSQSEPSSPLSTLTPATRAHAYHFASRSPGAAVRMSAEDFRATTFPSYTNMGLLLQSLGDCESLSSDPSLRAISINHRSNRTLH